jgi:hypothetical protein
VEAELSSSVVEVSGEAAVFFAKSVLDCGVFGRGDEAVFLGFAGEAGVLGFGVGNVVLGRGEFVERRGELLVLFAESSRQRNEEFGDGSLVEDFRVVGLRGVEKTSGYRGKVFSFFVSKVGGEDFSGEEVAEEKGEGRVCVVGTRCRSVVRNIEEA